MTIVGGIICACAPSFILFGIGRFLVGAGRIAEFLIGTILGAHFVKCLILFHYCNGCLKIVFERVVIFMSRIALGIVQLLICHTHSILCKAHLIC